MSECRKKTVYRFYLYHSSNGTFQIIVGSFGKSSCVAQLSNYKFISTFKSHKAVILNFAMYENHLEPTLVWPN